MPRKIRDIRRGTRRSRSLLPRSQWKTVVKCDSGDGMSGLLSREKDQPVLTHMISTSRPSASIHSSHGVAGLKQDRCTGNFTYLVAFQDRWLSPLPHNATSTGQKLLDLLPHYARTLMFITRLCDRSHEAFMAFPLLTSFYVRTRHTSVSIQ